MSTNINKNLVDFSYFDLHGLPTLNYPIYMQQRDSSTILAIANKKLLYRRKYQVATELKRLPRDNFVQIAARCFQVLGGHTSHTSNPEWNSTYTILFLAWNDPAAKLEARRTTTALHRKARYQDKSWTTDEKVP